jgi:hypothetical protein
MPIPALGSVVPAVDRSPVEASGVDVASPAVGDVLPGVLEANDALTDVEAVADAPSLDATDATDVPVRVEELVTPTVGDDPPLEMLVLGVDPLSTVMPTTPTNLPKSDCAAAGRTWPIPSVATAAIEATPAMPIRTRDRPAR